MRSHGPHGNYQPEVEQETDDEFELIELATATTQHDRFMMVIGKASVGLAIGLLAFTSWLLFAFVSRTTLATTSRICQFLVFWMLTSRLIS